MGVPTSITATQKKPNKIMNSLFTAINQQKFSQNE
jgi:hypothetical protein